MQIPRLRQILSRYISGRSTPDESRLVDQWLDTIERQSEADLPEDQKQITRDRLRNRIQARIHKPSRVVHMHVWMKWAAALIPICGVAIYLYVSFPGTSMITVSTGVNEQREIVLPDNSKVWLRPNSLLRYADSFEYERRVQLAGEAFFDVVRNPEKRFMVNTEDITVQVLGTSFNVKSYEKMPEVIVVVNTGKVRVDEDKRLLGTLLPNDKLTFHKRSGNASVSRSASIDPEAGQLIFDEVTIQEMATTLENYYAVTFKVETNEEARLSGAFDRNMEIGQVVEVLNTVMDRYDIKIVQQSDNKNTYIVR